jgi:hypothetical protein
VEWAWIATALLAALVSTSVTRRLLRREKKRRGLVVAIGDRRELATIEGLLTDVDVVLKQVRTTALTDVESVVSRTAFGGRVSNEQETEYVAKHLQRTLGYEFPSVAASYLQRRWSGDETLPPSRYYSVAFDPSGDDGGTLLAELRAYHNCQTSGVVLLYDTTSALDRDHMERSGVPKLESPTLLLDFCRTRRQPNPLVKTLGIPNDAFSFGLPLLIERRRLRRIVDLRDPATALRLAASLHRMAFGDPPHWVYPYLQRPATFTELIPSLMVQNLGGSSFLGFLALWLRHNGARGVIYPSARVDANVNVENGRVVSWTGFNYGNYSGLGFAVR